MQPRPVPGRQQGNPVSVDGFVRRPSQKTAAVSVHQRTQPTKTLMRHAVKAPGKLSTPQQAPQTSVTALQPQLSQAPSIKTPVVATKLSSSTVDPRRARRSLDYGRSQSVQHFRPHSQDRRHGYAGYQPQAAQPASPQPATAANFQAAPQHLAPLKPGQPASTASVQQFRQTEDDDIDMFAKALSEARSHEEKAPDESILQAAKRKGRRRRQALGIVGSLVLFAALAGFIGLQNKENIRLQLASAKAGFSAAVPLNKPAGYAMDTLTYAPGSVDMKFANGGNSFTITQKKSNWDSQTLLENFVATSNQDYQGYQSNGRTVYIYGKGLATWVNGGVWYQIKDAGSLTNEQLVRIAASM
jgi:hypothetical protein